MKPRGYLEAPFEAMGQGMLRGLDCRLPVRRAFGIRLQVGQHAFCSLESHRHAMPCEWWN